MPTPMATDTQIGNFESRADLVNLVAREETPFLSSIGWERIFNRRHYFSYQSLAKPSSTNQSVEGASNTHAAGDMTSAVEGNNTVETTKKLFEATWDQDATKKPQYGSGKESEFDRQAALKFKEVKRDMDAAMVSNNASTLAVSASSTSGVSQGAQSIIATQIDANDRKYGDHLLTLPMWHELNRKVYMNGGTPDKAFMGTFQKERAAGFVRNINRNISEAGTKLVDVVDSIKNVTGLVTELIVDPQIDILFPSVLLLIQEDLWKTGYLRSPGTYTEGLNGSKTMGWVDASWTLLGYGPAANGKMINLRSDA